MNTQPNIKESYYWIDDFQGTTRISHLKYLKISWVKCLILTPLSTILSGGILLILLFNYHLVRTYFFFSEVQINQATHVCVYGIDENIQIHDLISKNQINQDHFYYRGVPYSKVGKQLLPHQHTKSLNQHKLYFPSLPWYYLKTMLSPLFIYQIFMMIAYAVNDRYLVTAALAIASILSIVVNYIISYLGFQKLKKISQTQYVISVYQEQIISDKYNNEIKFGDIWVPKSNQIVPCDCKVVAGYIYVDQSNLTGQSVPIYKIPNLQEPKQKNMIFQGSKIVQVKDAQCQVAAVGFQTRKGRVLRGLLAEKQQAPQFYKNALTFQGALALIVFVAFFAMFGIVIQHQTKSILFFVLSLLAQAVPPFLGNLFNLTFAVALLRLNCNDITNIFISSTLQAGMLKTICFDKTGTLTSNDMQLQGISRSQQWKFIKKLNSKLTDIEQLIFATCHSCVKVGSYILGDSMQVEGIKFSQFQLQEDILTKKSTKYKRIKQFQFTSHLKRMSVLVQDLNTNTFFLVTKGAPQIVYQFCKNNSNQQKLRKCISQQFSSKGLRSLAYCIRKLTKQQLQLTRQQLEKQLQFVCLVGFSNALKLQTKETIQCLKQGQIICKMITGDQQYVAAQVARNAGIIDGQAVIINQNNIDKIDQLKEYLVIDCRLLHKLNIRFYQKISVFARANPQNKAQIVKALKDLTLQQLTCYQKWTRQRQRVGMIGDGANDILAISAADVGMGLSRCQSSYGSSYTLPNIESVLKVVSDGRATVANLMDLSRYTLIVNTLSAVVVLKNINFSSGYSSLRNIILNYAIYVPVLALFSLGTGTMPLSKYRISDRFFTFRNISVIVVYTLIFLGAFVTVTLIALQHFPSVNQRPIQLGIIQQTPLLAGTFMLQIIRYVLIPFALITGKPFKQPMYWNIPMLLFSIFWIVIEILVLVSSPKNAIYRTFLGDTDLGQTMKIAIGAGSLGALALCYVFEGLSRYCLGLKRY